MTSILSERIRIKTDQASKFKNKTEIGRSVSPTKGGGVGLRDRDFRYATTYESR